MGVAIQPRRRSTWTCDGIVCTGEVYKDKVKVTFARGASVPDPDGVFNASLGAGTRRAIDPREGEEVDAEAAVGEGTPTNHHGWSGRRRAGAPCRSHGRRRRISRTRRPTCP